MAHTKKSIAGNVNNGSVNTFSYSGSFDVFKASEVEVELDNVALTFTTSTINESANPREYTVDFTNKTVHIGGADLTSTDQVVIQPVTDMGSPTPRATYTPGASVTSADLNNNQLQLLRKAMEYDEQKLSSRGGTMTGNLHMGEDVNLSFEGATDNNFETTITVTDPTADRTITFPDSTGNVVTTGDTGTVSTAMIANDAVTSAKFADNSVTMAKLAGGTLPTDISVNGANITDLSVATADIANDAVTGAKIADDSINSEHYVDGSIDTAHIADNQVTTAKIADTNVTTAKIASIAVTDAKLASNAVTSSKITDANVTTTKIADSNITLAKLANDLKQTTISDSDTQLPTSGAVVDYVAAQLEPFGGFEAIANEVSFPNTQPASGVAISIADAAGIVVSGSNSSTTGRTVGGTTVTINNISSQFTSSTVSSGVRFIVTSTGSGHVYNYHKATLPESDLANLSGDINDFNERYRVGGSNPSSSLDGGDLFFNTTTGKLLVYNNTTSAWEEAQSIGNFFISTFSEAFDGSRQDFTLSNAPTSAQQIILSINGVIQKPNAGSSTPSEGFALSSSTVKLSAAPATGSTYHAVVMGSAVNIGTPSNNTVTTAILQDNAVATAKIADGAVTTAKIADEGVTLAKLPHGTSSNNGKFLRANNGADPTFETIDLTALSASNLTSGTLPDARFPATLPAVSAANLTNIPAANITGTLPAIDGSNLTGVSSPEVYGFKTTGSELQVTTTNGGADNISGTVFDAFEDVVLAATGFSFTVNANGKLIATI